jgi:hypothetical protein
MKQPTDFAKKDVPYVLLHEAVADAIEILENACIRRDSDALVALAITLYQARCEKKENQP